MEIKNIMSSINIYIRNVCFRIGIDTLWLEAIRIRYIFLYLPTCEMTAFVNVILQSVLSACLEIIVLRIAV